MCIIYNTYTDQTVRKIISGLSSRRIKRAIGERTSNETIWYVYRDGVDSQLPGLIFYAF